MLVAVVMLFVVGAMAALSIDAVTLYTARSEAQLAADGSALAGARVLVNSGMTSDTTGGLTSTAEAQAQAVATEVAQQNLVGGRNLVAAEVTVTFTGDTTPPTNPRITVRVQRTDLPTFFARIWGRTQIAVGASATAEAYNPSGASALGTTTPVALTCVKPWLLPNLDPSTSGTIFNATTGAITNTGLLGLSPLSSTPIPRLKPACTNCTSSPPGSLTAWKYYPGDTATTFVPPAQALPTCNPALATDYEKSIAGCVPTAIACGGPTNTTANIDFSDYDAGGGNRRLETARAVNCLAHTLQGPGGNAGDTVDTTGPPTSSFEFIAGAANPIAIANPSFAGKEMMVSDSLVTVPVFDSSSSLPPTGPVTVIGFVQLFLNPDGIHTPQGGVNQGYVNATVVNMAGCGTGATGSPTILGNGNSPVAVRLISGP
jgi:hypothetical protein